MASNMIIDLVKKSLETERADIEPEALASFLDVESAGKGFAGDGKLIIQFEPSYFRKRIKGAAPEGLWSKNGVEGQAAEWLAFNEAKKISEPYAIESTSLGMPQIMGAHWLSLNYRSAVDMWADFMTGEQAQVNALVRFIKTDSLLEKALRAKDWTKVATIYNGAGFREIAKKYGGDPYDIRLEKAYSKRKLA